MAAVPGAARGDDRGTAKVERACVGNRRATHQKLPLSTTESNRRAASGAEVVVARRRALRPAWRPRPWRRRRERASRNEKTVGT